MPLRAKKCPKKQREWQGVYERSTYPQKTLETRIEDRGPSSGCTEFIVFVQARGWMNERQGSEA